MSQLEYPGDFSIRYGYGNYGELKKVTDAGNQLIWEVKDVTPHGELEKIVYGNGLSTDLDYDDYHQLTDILTTNAGGEKRQHLQYSFQHQTGNLLSRTDKLLSTSGITETFTYDNLDRLTSYKVGSNPADTIAYNTDGTGRYISKTGLGVYHYGEDNAPELALTSVTGSDGTVINQAQQDISYTPFNKVEEITQGTKQLEITYSIDQQRKITKLYDGTTLIKKKTFVGGLYEIEEDQAGNKRHLYYIPGPTGEAAIFVKINTGAPAPYYIHKDHQGTYQTITNASGSTVEILSFDPWGRRRNATDWTYSGIPASFTFDRGYTGHEHLDAFGLINMNGRVYDPFTGQVLSPDPFISNPLKTQNFNRYSYVINNPLKYIDPSGYNQGAFPYDPGDEDLPSGGGGGGFVYDPSFIPVSQRSYVYQGRYYSNRRFPNSQPGNMSSRESSIYNMYFSAIDRGINYSSIQLSNIGLISYQRYTINQPGEWEWDPATHQFILNYDTGVGLKAVYLENNSPAASGGNGMSSMADETARRFNISDRERELYEMSETELLQEQAKLLTVKSDNLRQQIIVLEQQLIESKWERKVMIIFYSRLSLDLVLFQFGSIPLSIESGPLKDVLFPWPEYPLKKSLKTQ